MKHGSLIAVVALMVAFGGVVVANIPDSAGVIHGCINKRGKLRLIDVEANPPGTCRPRERAIQWNQEGPEGEPGPATGPAGGALDGSYPDPTLRDGSVTAAAHAPLPAVRVQQADNPALTIQTIPSSATTTFTNLTFDLELYDTDDMFDPAQPTRITARTPGIYVITGAVRWNANDTGSRSIGLVRNAIGIAFLAADTRDATDGNATRQNVSTVTRLGADDFVELKVSQDSGGDLNVSNNGSPQVHLSATWLAP